MQGEGLRPLAFMSRALKSTEQQYSAYERELVAIAYCLVQWRHYLEGRPRGIIVMTDYKPNGLASLVPVSDTVDSAWIISIDPTKTDLSTGQGKYCC